MKSHGTWKNPRDSPGGKVRKNFLEEEGKRSEKARSRKFHPIEKDGLKGRCSEVEGEGGLIRLQFMMVPVRLRVGPHI